MTEENSTSLTLLLRVCSGEPDAWGRFVALYGPFVYDQCMRFGFAHSDAEDVTQEVFLCVSKSLAGFRKEQPDDSFSAWLKTIAKRRMVDWLRKNADRVKAAGGSSANIRIQQLPELVQQEWNPDDARRDAHRRALAMLKTDFQESTWKAFELSILQEKTTAAVAEALDMKPAAVRKARSRVRKRLYDEFHDLLELPAELPA